VNWNHVAIPTAFKFGPTKKLHSRFVYN